MAEPTDERTLTAAYEAAVRLDGLHSVLRRRDEVEVRLRGGQEQVAAQLHETFGGAVKIWVGVWPYPFEPGAPDRPQPAPQTTAALGPVRCEVSPVEARAADSTRAGRGGVHGVVRIAPTGKQRLRFATDDPVGGVLLDTTGRCVGGDSTVMRMSGIEVDANPGDTFGLRFRVGTESCARDLGTTLPPGTYRLVVVIPLYPDGGQYVTDPIAVRLS